MKTHERLIRAGDVLSENLGSLDVDNVHAIERATEYATRQIEQYLERKLIVRERLDLGRNVDLEFDYDVSTDTISYYSYYTGDWPVLEPISVTPDDYTLQVHPDGRRFFTDIDSFDERIRRVRYFAGYRRRDQDLSSLQSEDGLSDLSTEPPLLPDDIRNVALRITIHRLQAMQGQGLGLGQRDLNVGAGQIVTAAEVDSGFVQRELQSLNDHRSIAW